mmetsp:Transcript_21276/g.27001  ORF Transcript_21276/g.27001 Transcript_21276/m.27001 type:complete len:319 (-) Transcript_21276:77-1033(-)
MDTLFSYFSHDKSQSNVPPKEPENNNESSEVMADSVILETAKWSPYQNFVVFSSTVLLWQRPVIFVLLAICTHLFLWYTTVAIFKWNFWIVVGALFSMCFITDYMCSLFGFTLNRFLTIFPYDGTERVSYQEIIQQYVTVRRFFRAQFYRALEFRKEQHQQFLISALFFTILTCFILSLVNVFTLVYVMVFVCLFTPGLWHNNIPRRVYVFAWPHVSSMYTLANQTLTEILAPKENNPNPSAPRHLNRQPKPKPNQNAPNQNEPPAYLQPQRPSATAPMPQTQEFFTQPPVQTIPPANYYNPHNTRPRPTKRQTSGSH